MRALLVLFLVFASVPQSLSQQTTRSPASPPTGRPVHTYSIVARDPNTGELGVAVQSHWFSVGTVVAWAEAGVGAIATQSFVDPSYGKLGLDLMRAGKSAPDALKSLLAGDEAREVRQVAMIDAQGRVEAWTGKNNIQSAGNLIGKNFSVQANLMLNDKVWPAMAQAFENSKGDLAERMLAALDAAQAVGGDIRGKQSAALVVVSGKPTGQSWKDRTFDLRVDDSPEPLRELRRLVTLQRAYNHMNAGDLAVGPLICFESAFPDLARNLAAGGAEVLVVQTADTTFQGSWGLDQHASLSAVRAVESGRPVLQAALSGTSAAFDARGRRLAWAPGDWRGAAGGELPRPAERTPYVRIGDAVPVACLLALAAVTAGSGSVSANRSSTRARSAASSSGPIDAV